MAYQARAKQTASSTDLSATCKDDPGQEWLLVHGFTTQARKPLLPLRVRRSGGPMGPAPKVAPAK
eukprot:5679057-Pyramimonas_sp.AAC.1